MQTPRCDQMCKGDFCDEHMEVKSRKRDEDGNSKGSIWAMVGWERTGEKKNYIVTPAAAQVQEFWPIRGTAFKPTLLIRGAPWMAGGMESGSPALQADSLPSEPRKWKTIIYRYRYMYVCIYTHIHITSMFKFIYSVSIKFASQRCHFLISRWLMTLFQSAKINLILILWLV